MPLSGKSLGELTALIVHAYNPDDLNFLLRTKFDQPLDHLVAPGSTFPITVGNLLITLESRGLLVQFLQAVKLDRPNRADIQAIRLDEPGPPPSPPTPPPAATPLPPFPGGVSNPTIGDHQAPPETIAAVLQELIETALRDDELDGFCQELDPEVAAQCTPGEPRSVRVRLLVEDANRRNQLAQLLSSVRGKKTAQYFEFESRLRDALLRRAEQEWQTERAPFLSRDAKGQLEEPKSQSIETQRGCAGGMILLGGLGVVVFCAGIIRFISGHQTPDFNQIFLVFWCALVFVIGILNRRHFTEARAAFQRYATMKRLHANRVEWIEAMRPGSLGVTAPIRETLLLLSDDAIRGLVTDDFPLLKDQVAGEQRERVHALLRYATKVGVMEVDRLLACAIRAVGKESTTGRQQSPPVRTTTATAVPSPEVVTATAVHSQPTESQRVIPDDLIDTLRILRGNLGRTRLRFPLVATSLILLALVLGIPYNLTDKARHQSGSDLYVVSVYGATVALWLVSSVLIQWWVPRALQRRREAAVEAAVSRLEQRYPRWIAEWGGAEVLRNRKEVSNIILRLQST